MTTTLRPLGPEQHGPDGLRSRSYDVCVNGRPVGAIHLSTHQRFGPSVGRILRLAIDEPDRRRGRGTVAALAAEEVLRGWGCRRIEVTVPAAAVAARRLAAALGYQDGNHTMVKRLPDLPPALPEGSESRAMNEVEFPAWLEAAKVSYARTWIERGVPEEQARAKSEADHASLLPDGLRTPDAVLRILSHRGTDVGSLWLSLAAPLPDDDLDAFVVQVEVAAEHRGRGHGRSLMLVAEQQCRAAGGELTGLNVFAGNTPALRLYESLGYEATRHHLFKQLL